MLAGVIQIHYSIDALILGSNEWFSMSNAELCSECGILMTVIPNPSPEMLQANEGFEQFKEFIIDFMGEFDIEAVQMAFCNKCDCAALLGPVVVFAGTIVGSDE